MKLSRNSKGQFMAAEAQPKRPADVPRGRSGGATLDVSGQRGAYTSLGYRAVRVARKDGVTGIGASAERHMLYDRKSLIDQSRMFMRDNGIYRGMIGRAVSFIVGAGFSLQAKTKSKTFNTRVEALWREYWRRPEIKQLLMGLQLEKMVCREAMVAGDTGLIKTKMGLVQLVEAEQIAGKRGISGDGISKDKWGRPTRFHVGGYGRGGRVDEKKRGSYSPKDFLFVTDPDRPSAVMTPPPCQSTFAMLHRINDVCDSEAIAWQMLARMAVSITREAGAAIGHQESRADPDKSAAETAGDLATRLTELDVALIFHGEPGEEVKGIERNIPGKDFSESLRMFLRLLGLPLGLPLELILLDWTKGNYSQSRAVLEQAYQTFLGWQKLLEASTHSPIYEWKVAEWIRAGLLPDRPDALAHEWIKPSFPWIDKLKEAQSYGVLLDRGLTTHALACKALNADRGEIVEAREREVRDAIERANRIKDETQVEVPWQIFCGLKTPKADAGRPDGDEPNNPADKEKEQD